jgi:hypothetical protein
MDEFLSLFLSCHAWISPLLRFYQFLQGSAGQYAFQAATKRIPKGRQTEINHSVPASDHLLHMKYEFQLTRRYKKESDL